MNKVELCAKVAEKTEITKKDATLVVDTVIDTIKETIASGEKISLVGFGTFDITERAAREGRNPLTGESIKIKASKSPKFKASKAFKELVNEA